MSKAMVKTVAVIGVGASGLAAIKCCLDEGLEPTCFERTTSMGGLWNFTEEVREGQACVMRSTVINTSKEMTCYSDFPIPKEFPNYMPNWDVMKYFHMYMDKFNLEKYIRFNTAVTSVVRSVDFETSGKWDITVQEEGKEPECLTFDAVLVCTGHHADKYMPPFPGMEKFKGKIIHSHDLKDAKGMEGKRAVVLGIGNSGGDATVELSRLCSTTFVATRRGTWIFRKVGKDNLPGDMLISPRLNWVISKAIVNISPRILNALVIRDLNRNFNHKMFCLEPAHSPFSQHPMVNDELPNRLISGLAVVKPNIQEFTETGVKFVDGTFEDNIDLVVFATGYIFGFPFLEKEVIDVKDNKIELYKYAFPPNLARPTIAIIGCLQPLGSTIPIAELQSRLATRVFKGDVTLPSREEMWKDIRMKQQAMAQRYVNTQRHTIQVDYVPFMDELAELNGCKPDLVKLLLSDPKLFYHIFAGPCTPVQYRLMGPGAWPGARDAILTTWERMRFPLQTRPMQTKEEQTDTLSKIYIIMAVLLAIVLYLIFGSI